MAQAAFARPVGLVLVAELQQRLVSREQARMQGATGALLELPSPESPSADVRASEPVARVAKVLLAQPPEPKAEARAREPVGSAPANSVESQLGIGQKVDG